MHKRYCLITGATSGIGKALARHFSLAAYHVILVCRNEKKGQVLLQELRKGWQGEDIDLCIADLSSQASVRNLAKEVQERFPALHVLINNAGVVMREREESIDGIEMTLATNHLGPLLLNQLLMDWMKLSDSAEIMNISSAIHRFAKLDFNDLQFQKRPYRFMSAYAQSKLLMNLSSFYLAKSLEGSSLSINCIHPGAVKTKLGSTSKNPYFYRILDRLIKHFFRSPDVAADEIVRSHGLIQLEKLNGKYFEKGKIAVPSKASRDLSLMQKAWDESFKLIV